MSDSFLGEIRMFGGSFAPFGWAFCWGQEVAIADYDALYTLIGTTYGGDGMTTFAMPNLQSRIPLHQDSNHPLGSMAGAETVTLTTQQLPGHQHAAVASSSAATSTGPAGKTWAPWADQQYSSASPTATINAAALSSAGANLPHENMPPFLVVNFIISTSGIFPPFN